MSAVSNPGCLVSFITSSLLASFRKAVPLSAARCRNIRLAKIQNGCFQLCYRSDERHGMQLLADLFVPGYACDLVGRCNGSDLDRPAVHYARELGPVRPR